MAADKSRDFAAECDAQEPVSESDVTAEDPEEVDLGRAPMPYEAVVRGMIFRGRTEPTYRRERSTDVVLEPQITVDAVELWQDEDDEVNIMLRTEGPAAVLAYMRYWYRDEIVEDILEQRILDEVSVL